MNKYKILESENLGIILDGNFARRLRGVEMDGRILEKTKDTSRGIVGEDAKISFIENSPLLCSIGYSAGGICSTYMDDRQRNYFQGAYWVKKKLPWAMWADEGEVLYVAHNGNRQVNEFLKELWTNWFDLVKDF